MLVLDLSNNNNNPNFQTLKKNGVEGVMLKVSEGATFVDPVFQNWAGRARAAGMRVGGYHFAQPNGGDPIAEARHFAKHLGTVRRRDFKPALDLEANPGNLSWDELEVWARAFNQEVKRLNGHVPMFYASRYWIEKMKPTTPVGGALWLAHWSLNGEPFNPVPPAPWVRVPMHQYTSKGRINGISGNVDKNQVLHKRRVLAHPVLGWL